MDDFTSMETARFMASLFTIDSEKQVLYALDAGAGSGYKNLMLRTLVKRFVSRRFTIFVMRHLLRIMVSLQIAQITDIG